MPRRGSPAGGWPSETARLKHEAARKIMAGAAPQAFGNHGQFLAQPIGQQIGQFDDLKMPSALKEVPSFTSDHTGQNSPWFTPATHPPRITDDPDYHYQPVPGGIRDNRPPAVADTAKHHPFLVQYIHAGKTYTVEIFAPTEHEALEHVQSLRLTAMLLGSSVRRAS